MSTSTAPAQQMPQDDVALTEAERRFIDFLVDQALELLADRSHEPQR